MYTVYKYSTQVMAFHKRILEAVLANSIYDLIKYAVLVSSSIVLFTLYKTYHQLTTTNISITYFDAFLVLVATGTLSYVMSSFIHGQRFARLHTDLLTDQLTGLPNDRALHLDLPKVIDFARKEGLPLSLVFIDVDNFGNLNKNYGQNFADDVLRKFGEFLRNDKRITDKMYRQHGDEFIIIAKETNLDGAVKAADRKRELIANSFRVSGEDGLRLMVCCGVVALTSDDDSDGVSILARAHEAMIEAKAKRGKNNTVSIF